MPWKECHVVDERLRFIARLRDGEKMARLCAEFGISRKTGYKIRDRYERCGLEALTDRKRRPYRQANQLPPLLEREIIRLKREFPTWGAPKLRERLRRRIVGVRCPAISTVHAASGAEKRKSSRSHGSVARSTVSPGEERGEENGAVQQ